MDIADHQSSWVSLSGWWTKFSSLPYPTIVPSANALSRIALLAELSFAISAQCARGICQLAIYEYIEGFSFTSDVCALDGMADRVDNATAQIPAKMLDDLLFILFLRS